MSVAFELYPAIDVRDGRTVRLHQGDYARETRYDEAPLALARHHAAAGARWLHLVDLDAARAGGYTLLPLLRQIRSETALQMQTGGGIRGEADVVALLEAGAARVVIGSLAVRDPALVAQWITRYGADRITVALDARRNGEGAWRLPVAGWTEDSGVGLDDMAECYVGAGLVHLLCTDIDRDGTLTGPNLDLYRHLTTLVPGLQVQASGGVRDIDDIIGARAAGCAGAVLGKALLDGRFTLRDALAC